MGESSNEQEEKGASIHGGGGRISTVHLSIAGLVNLQITARLVGLVVLRTGDHHQMVEESVTVVNSTHRALSY